MRLDTDSFFFTFGKWCDDHCFAVVPDVSDSSGTPRPFSVNCHSPVEFHLLHLFIEHQQVLLDYLCHPITICLRCEDQMQFIFSFVGHLFHLLSVSTHSSSFQHFLQKSRPPMVWDLHRTSIYTPSPICLRHVCTHCIFAMYSGIPLYYISIGIPFHGIANPSALGLWPRWQGGLPWHS